MSMPHYLLHIGQMPGDFTLMNFYCGGGPNDRGYS